MAFSFFDSSSARFSAFGSKRHILLLNLDALDRKRLWQDLKDLLQFNRLAVDECNHRFQRVAAGFHLEVNSNQARPLGSTGTGR